MQTHPFQVEIEEYFSGPADLLLYLVRKQEVNVLSFSVAKIIEEFFEYLNVLEIIDFDLSADFLVTAAGLLEIKSHLALAKQEDDEPEEEEVDEQVEDDGLIQHLLQYRQLKEAAVMLQEQALAWHDRYPRLVDERPTAKRSIADDQIKDIEVWDLVGAFARIVKKKADVAEAMLQFVQTPIHVYVDQIGEQVRQSGRVRFQDLFENEEDRSRIVGMFLAVLELVRHHAYRASQEIEFGEIWILPPLESEQTSEETEAA